MDELNTAIDWGYLVDLVNAGKCTPLISNKMVMDYIFGQWDYIRAWAEDVGYPMTDFSSPAHIAHYLSITSGDELVAKSNYLRFLKDSLLQQVAQNAAGAAASNPFIETLTEELPRLTFSQAALRLGFVDPDQRPDNPFALLAKLPLPIYLTTSYHTFMEEALRLAGKQPHTATYNWSEEFGVPTFTSSPAELGFQPTVAEPLVYHFHGLDDDSSSLVLTEENFFEFFEQMSRDLERTSGLPDVVRIALATSSTLLLGYDIQSWAFRVVFRGPIKAIFNRKRPLSLCIQLVPKPESGIIDTEEFRNYLHSYLRGYKFSVYWGNVDGFVKTLWTEWEG